MKEYFMLDHCYYVLWNAPCWISRLESLQQKSVVVAEGSSSRPTDSAEVPSSSLPPPQSCEQSKEVANGKRKTEDMISEMLDIMRASKKRSRAKPDEKTQMSRELLDWKYMSVEPSTITDPIRRRFFLLKQKQVIQRQEASIREEIERVDLRDTSDEDDDDISSIF